MTSYEQVENDRRARYDTFQTVTLPAIVAELNKIEPSARWSLEQKDDDRAFRNISNPSGERIWIRLDGYSRVGKLDVSGTYGQHLNGRQWIPRDSVRTNDGNPSDPRPSISADKAPAQIARDIARRLLPDYRKLRALYLATLERERAYQSGRDGLFSELLKLAPGKLVSNESQHRPTAPDGERSARFNADGISYGDLRASDGHVRIEMSVTPDFARTFARLLATMPEATEQD